MWIEAINQRIDSLIEKLEMKEVQRLQLDYLKVVAKRLDLEAETCEKCQYLKKDLEEALEVIERSEVIKEVQRRAYNSKMKALISHFRHVHHLKSANHYANQFSHYGLLAGILMSIWFLDHLFIMVAILLLCPFVFRFIGIRKDKKRSDDLI